MSRILVVGSYNKSLTVFSEHLPHVGETVRGHHADIGPGGKGSNQAIGAARLGADVVFLVKVGPDAFGAEARRLFESEGLPLEGILQGQETTGLALILVDADGDNMISVAPGANDELSHSDLAMVKHLLDDVTHAVFQLECPVDLFINAASALRSRGVATILNPAPATPLPVLSLPLIDILTPNQRELGVISGADVFDDQGILSSARSVIERGVSSVIVTLGARGAVLVTQERESWFDAYKVQVVDTTGAGDAFNAGLVTALSEGAQIDEAVDLALRAGAFCAGFEGVIGGLPTRTELDRLIPSRLL